MQNISIEAILAVAAFLGIFAALVVQALKSIIPEGDEGDGPRKYLPLGMMGGMGVFGIIIALISGYDLVTWFLAGVISGAVSVGTYAGGKVLVPGVFNSDGWLSFGGDG